MTYKPKAVGVLTESAEQVLIALFEQSVNHVIDRDDVTFEVDGVNSSLLIKGRTLTGTGDIGRYTGSFEIPYQKIELDSVLPYPVGLEVDYPLTYEKLTRYLFDTYRLYFEPEELASPLTPTVGYLLTQTVDAPVDPTTGWVELVVTPTSGRFVSGGIFRLATTTVHGARLLKSVFRQQIPFDLKTLKTTVNSIGALSLFDATAKQCCLDLLARLVGVSVDERLVNVYLRSNGYEETWMTLEAVAGNALWRGTQRIVFQKAKLSELLPETLCVNIPLPASFEAIAQSLKQTYGFVLEEGVFSFSDYLYTLFTKETVVTYENLDPNGRLSLMVNDFSLKWQGRDVIDLQFVQSAKNLEGPQVTSDAPHGKAGMPWYYEVVIEGGTAPYTVRVVKGTPPAPKIEADVSFGGNVTAGDYIWTIRVTDSMGRFSFKTNVVTIVA